MTQLMSDLYSHFEVIKVCFNRQKSCLDVDHKGWPLVVLQEALGHTQAKSAENIKLALSGTLIKSLEIATYLM